MLNAEIKEMNANVTWKHDMNNHFHGKQKGRLANDSFLQNMKAKCFTKLAHSMFHA